MLRGLKKVSPDGKNVPPNVHAHDNGPRSLREQGH